MGISATSDSATSDDTLDPHDLYHPTLNELYARIEKTKQLKTYLSIVSALSFISAIPAFYFSPLTSCGLTVIGIASLIYTTILKKTPPYLILAIDGGGIRGIIPAQLLSLIEKEVGRPIGELFDCIAGTSIGGILALALAQENPRRSAVEACHFLEHHGATIFERTQAERVQSLDGLRAPKYSNQNLSHAVEEAFQSSMLHDSITDLVITSYDLSSGKPMIFSTFRGQKTSSYKMQDVALATSAAPVYFPSYPLNNLNLVDGGLVANNPSLLALIQAKKAIDPRRDIFILSLGTGERALKSIPASQSMRYGMIQWVPLLFDLIFNSMHAVQLQGLKHIQETSSTAISFLRLQPELLTKEQELLDNGSSKNIRDLKKIATTHFHKHHAQINKEIIEPLKKYRA